MKRKWIETGQNLLIILINHLLLVSFSVTVIGMFMPDGHKVWLWSSLLIIPLIFYWMRIKIRNFPLFFALHLCVPVGMLFLPVHILTKILMVFTGVVYVIWSIRIRMKERGHGEGVVGPVSMIGALGVMLLIETSYSQKGWEGIYIAMAIIYAAGYYMYIFTSRYLNFLIVNESSAANIPEAEIFNNGFRQSFMYVAGVVTFLVLTANMEWLSYILSRIGKIVLKLLVYLFFRGRGAQEEIPVEMPVEQMEQGMGMLPPGSGPALIWVILEKFIMIGVPLFLMGLTLFGIVKGVQYLWKRFHKTSKEDEKKINSEIDIRETCTIEKTKKEGNNWFSFFNNREKIRKIYRKQVLKNKTAIVGTLSAEDLEYMTAKECCDKFAAEQLKEMYEKARYSAEEITSYDVRAAKSGGRVER